MNNTSALDRVRSAVQKAERLRHLNFLITETFELAERHCVETIATNKHLKPMISSNRIFRMVIKDNYAVKDVRMTCASKMLRDFIAPYTATCVQRLLDNGGCLIGKSNMDEFAMGSTTTTGCFGPVLHASYADQAPFDPKEADDFRIAGGSSGGCAVAVATGVAEVAIGSDTGGSVRYPAALNGVYGFKPSYGRLSRHGLVPLANALDTPSIFAASVSDCRYFYDLLKGHDPMDSTTLTGDVDSRRTKLKPIEGFRDLVVGIPVFGRDILSEDARGVWHAATDWFASQGATIREVHLPHAEYAFHCYSVVVEVDVASSMARYDGIRYGHRSEEEEGITYLEHITRSRTEAFGRGVKRRIFAGNFYALEENFTKYVEQAAKVQRLIQRDFAQAFCHVDCILTPVTRHSAPLLSQVLQRPREEQRLDDYFVLPTNLCGIPSISIPYAKCSDGLPLGVQLVAPYLEDDRLLDMAELLPPVKDGAGEGQQ